MDNTTSWIVGAIVLVAIGGGVYLINRSPNPTDDTTNNPSNTKGDNTVAPGRVVFSVTDAAANMANVNEINIKINSVEVHNTTTGWTTVSNTSRVFSLLMLKTKKESELLADITVKAGAYDQVRLMLDSVSINTKAGKTVVATLPSKFLIINTTLNVTSNLTSSVNFDFLADKSLHTTAKGEYVFAPVVTTQVKSSPSVAIDTANVVTITGGTIDSTSNVGMDIDGTMKVNFTISSTKSISIVGDTVVGTGDPITK